MRQQQRPTFIYRNPKRKSTRLCIERRNLPSAVWVFTICLANLSNRFNILIIAELDSKSGEKLKVGRVKWTDRTNTLALLVTSWHQQIHTTKWMNFCTEVKRLRTLSQTLVKFEAGILKKKTLEEKIPKGSESNSNFYELMRHIIAFSIIFENIPFVHLTCVRECEFTVYQFIVYIAWYLCQINPYVCIL